MVGFSGQELKINRDLHSYMRIDFLRLIVPEWTFLDWTYIYIRMDIFSAQASLIFLQNFDGYPTRKLETWQHTFFFPASHAPFRSDWGAATRNEEWVMASPPFQRTANIEQEPL